MTSKRINKNNHKIISIMASCKTEEQHNMVREWYFTLADRNKDYLKISDICLGVRLSWIYRRINGAK